MTHTLPFVVRDARPGVDDAGAARAMTLANPGWPWTPALLQAERDARDPSMYARDLLAEADGEIVGVGTIALDDFARAPGKYWTMLHVRPDWQRRGVGTHLLQELLRGANAHEPLRLVQGMRAEDQAGAEGFLNAHGFREVWRRYESRLQTRDLDFTPYADVEARVRAHGTRILTYTQARADFGEPLDRWLHALDEELFLDVPIGDTPTGKSFETWRAQELHGPEFVPDATFLAVQDGEDGGARGPLIGWSSLRANPGGFWVIGMTGVVRAHRSRGLALTLKLQGMRYAQAHGGGEIRTFNDAPNAAMLGMNDRLGFIRHTAHLRYARAFA
ncbi:GNAT family N-acetyltransferase [Deinococcus maricopensis]|uniref:GCN5-related N-acetyltransferase n=1 Tax=Deinococcus maricopensis (strain DSM 21211 / LMG 22137 / NRRL B-23946 / LB-34) TaxID=709986 RepID=E8U5Q6_DEIML|nr:GNAT family N-acetyltransferase [Deinococcus maricopensis]ADV66395.1 GCN5-related N-acetyltransferase [Deinococcus maricopensis DSM 21211]